MQPFVNQDGNVQEINHTITALGGDVRRRDTRCLTPLVANNCKIYKVHAAIIAAQVSSGTPHKNISRAGVNVPDVPRPRDGEIAAYRNRIAKPVFGSTIRGEQLSLLAPAILILPKYISRAGVAVLVVIAMRPYNCIIAAYRNRRAKKVYGITVRGGELLLLAPTFTVSLEYISRAGVASFVVIAIRPYDCIIATYRNRPAKVVVGITIPSAASSLACWLQTVPSRLNI